MSNVKLQNVRLIGYAVGSHTFARPFSFLLLVIAAISFDVSSKNGTYCQNPYLWLVCLLALGTIFG